MKKSLILGAAALTLAGLTWSCSDDNNDGKNDPDIPGQSSKDIDYTAENAANWHNYSVQVARLLEKDSQDLYNAWSVSYEGGRSYADIFRNHNGGSYTSALNCIEEIIDGCAEIANEVGEAKIGDPYDLYMNKRYEEALYAVESWYSWHSREDYSNNIYSIRNSYFGSLDGSVNPASISALVASVNPSLDTRMKDAISSTAKAILDIPQPFRNNINSSEARAAMTKCAELDALLSQDLKSFMQGLDSSHDAAMQAIVERYVDGVVLPTYADLRQRNADLRAAVEALAASPSNAAFEAAAAEWLKAREPWERSEAFLFGPVDALGLDPNMDSWPLDQDAIVGHLKSGSFDDLDWGDGDDGQKVEAAQNIRGFHTLEFLLFKDGNPRVVK